MDFEGPGHGRRQVIAEAEAAGALVVLYPHGARPLLFEGLYRPDPRVDLQLVPAPGHIGVYRAQGVRRRMLVTGFAFARRRPFRPGVPSRVLFAPTHPRADGWLLEKYRRANLEAYECLLGLPGRAVLTVRTFGGLEANGLYAHPRCVYERSDMTVSSAVAAVDAASLVVADGTFAYLAVARGVPTVMFGQDVPETDDDGLVEVGCWGSLAPTFRYPYDISDGGLSETVAAACAGGPELDVWTRMFVGGAFNADWFASRVVGLLERHSALEVTRR